MNELNVFCGVFEYWGYPGNWFRNIKNLFRRFKFCWQRITKGYCDKDLWDWDIYHTQLVINSLRHFVKVNDGWPDQNFSSFEEWQNAILECADKLESFLDCELENEERKTFTNDYEEEFHKILSSKNADLNCKPNEEIMEKYYNREKEIFKECNKLRLEAYEFLNQYGPNIWW